MLVAVSERPETRFVLGIIFEVGFFGIINYIVIFLEICPFGSESVFSIHFSNLLLKVRIFLNQMVNPYNIQRHTVIVSLVKVNCS